MNTYIQDKLDEIEDDLKEKGYTKHERETVIGILEQSLTDYHNHIVEKLHNQVESMYDQEQWEFDTCVNFVNTFVENVSLLQDTNPKE